MELRKVSKTLPPVLKALSDATVDTKVAKSTFAILDNTRKREDF